MLALGNRARIGQNKLDRVGVYYVYGTELVNSFCIICMTSTVIQHLIICVAPSNAIALVINATRSSKNSYVIPRTKCTAQLNFEVIGAKEWNDLPPNVKLLESKDSFKKAVRAYLKTQAHAAESSDYVYYQSFIQIYINLISIILFILFITLH